MEKTQPQLLDYINEQGTHAFSTTRGGGFSKGAYSSFNINRYCGDSPDAIARNLSALCAELNIPENHLIMPHQVHGTKIAVIDEDILALTAEERDQQLEGIDGVVTSLRDVCIGVSTADCVPVLIYNKEKHIAAAVHAGWRGTVKRIVKKALETLSSRFNMKGEQLSAIIGPSISLKAFEVGEEVYQAFAQAGFSMPLIAERFPAKAPWTEKWHIDLWQANALQLLEGGIPSDRIRVAGICTYAQYERFFSARRLGIHSGRIYTGILFPSDKE